MNKCPFLRAAGIVSPDVAQLDTTWKGDECLCEMCELWNKSLGKCALAVDAYLKGLEVERKEQ